MENKFCAFVVRLSIHSYFCALEGESVQIRVYINERGTLKSSMTNKEESNKFWRFWCVRRAFSLFFNQKWSHTIFAFAGRPAKDHIVHDQHEFRCLNKKNKRKKLNDLTSPFYEFTYRFVWTAYACAWMCASLSPMCVCVSIILTLNGCWTMMPKIDEELFKE